MRLALAFTILFTFSCLSSAALEAGILLERDSFADGSILADFEANGSFSFSQSPSAMKLSFMVVNPEPKPIDIYLAVFDKDEKKWAVIKQLGRAPPRGTMMFEYETNFEYAGLSSETDEFALIGESDKGLVGKVFTIEENWEDYERQLKSSIGLAALIALPSAFLLMVALGIFVYSQLGRGRLRTEEGEYTLSTLFFPRVKGRPISELIADVMINPVFWAFEALSGLVLVCLILIFSISMINWEIALLIFVVGGAVCWLMPFIYVITIWLLEVWEREPLRFPFALFMWGIFAAFIAFWLNLAVDFIGGGISESIFGSVGSGLFTLLSAILIAPFIEEFAKGFGVLIASGHHELDDTFDGILYGFAAGAGFSAIENWLYFAVQNNPAAAGGFWGWVFLIVYRSVFDSLGHGWFTACIGGMIGFMKARQSLRRYAILGFFPGWLLASVLHALFNLFAVVDGIINVLKAFPVFVFNPAMLFLTTLVFAVIITFALKESKDRVERGV